MIRKIFRRRQPYVKYKSKRIYSIGEYLKSTRLNIPFIQSRLEEEQHHHFTKTSGYSKAKTAASVIGFQKPQEKVWLSGITHIWQNKQAGMSQKGVLYYTAKTEMS